MLHEERQVLQVGAVGLLHDHSFACSKESTENNRIGLDGESDGHVHVLSLMNGSQTSASVAFLCFCMQTRWHKLQLTKISQSFQRKVKSF